MSPLVFWIKSLFQELVPCLSSSLTVLTIRVDSSIFPLQNRANGHRKSVYNYQEGEDEFSLVSAFVYCSVIVKYVSSYNNWMQTYVWGFFQFVGVFEVDFVSVLGGFWFCCLFVCFLSICCPFSVHCSSVDSNDLFLIPIRVTTYQLYSF